MTTPSIDQDNVTTCVGQLESLKQAASEIYDLALQCDSHEIYLIKHVELEEGDDEYRSLTLTADDYRPLPATLDDLKAPLAFMAPANHANNSLPRYIGYISLPRSLSQLADDLIERYKALQNEFKLSSKQLAESTNIPTISRTSTLRRAEVFSKGENYELTQRRIDLINETGIQEVQARWIINHYSQPTKRTAREMVDYINNTKQSGEEIATTDSFKILEDEVKHAIQEHGSDITFVKRFYVPPYISTRYKNAEGKWSANLYTSFPVLFIGLDETCRIKVKIPKLDTYIEAGSIRASNPKARKSSAPKPIPMSNNWHIIPARSV